MFESLDRWLTILVLRIVPLWCTPNHITLTRFFAIPLIFILYFSVSPWVGTAICPCGNYRLHRRAISSWAKHGLLLGEVSGHRM